MFSKAFFSGCLRNKKYHILQIQLLVVMVKAGCICPCQLYNFPTTSRRNICITLEQTHFKMINTYKPFSQNYLPMHVQVLLKLAQFKFSYKLCPFPMIRVQYIQWNSLFPRNEIKSN